MAHQNELRGQDLAHGGIGHAGDRGPRDKRQGDDWQHETGRTRQQGFHIAREQTVEEVGPGDDAGAATPACRYDQWGVERCPSLK